MATLFDIPEIKACALVCDPSYIKELDPEVVNSFLNDCVLSPHKFVYVAEYGGRIVGHVIANMLTCYKSKKEEQDDKEGDKQERREGYISWLNVDPNHRKLGIATKLMTAAEKAPMVHGCEYVYLHVRVSNHAAINLYTKILGYNIRDTKAKFFDDGEDAYLMRKQLPGKQPHLHGRKATHGGGCFSSKATVALGWKFIRNLGTGIKKKFSLPGYRTKKLKQ